LFLLAIICNRIQVGAQVRAVDAGWSIAQS